MQAVIVKVKFCCMIQGPVGQLFPETLLRRISLERWRNIKTVDTDVSDGLNHSQTNTLPKENDKRTIHAHSS